MRRFHSALLAVALVVFAAAALVFAAAALVSPTAPSVVAGPVVAGPVAAPVCVASTVEPMVGCGEIHCARDADCPSTCGGCITWSGTCALFRPR